MTGCATGRRAVMGRHHISINHSPPGADIVPGQALTKTGV